MAIMQLRTADDVYPLSRLDFGAVDTGTTSVSIGFRLWNDKPTRITGELLGTGDGSRVSFATQFKPIISHAEAAVAVYVDGSAASGITVDYENGLIVFSAPPADGALVTADYSYSVGSADANAVVLVMEQVASFAGDGATQLFTLPSRCLTPIKLLVAGAAISESGYELQENGEKLYLYDAPEAGEAVLFSYADPVSQGGYYEVRSSGVDNPYSQSNFVDDAESSFFKIGGALEYDNRLIGTGDGATKAFATGTPLIREITGVTVGGVPETEYSVNNVTGVITFTTAPATDAEIRMSYSYERGHRIGNIRQWCARRCYIRVSLPYDAPNAVLSARLRVISQ